MGDDAKAARGRAARQPAARETGIPKATVSRLTYTLSAYGYLNFSPEIGKY